MEDQNRMAHERQILLSNQPVPRRSVAALSAGVHLAAVILVLALRNAGPHVVQPKTETVQVISSAAHLAYQPGGQKAGRPQREPSLLSLRRRLVPVPPLGNAKQGAALQALRQHAKAATAGMLDSIKVRQFYGFSSEHYDLPSQTAGKLPDIAASDLPPRFEQYVTVEVTIDEAGHVADVRVVGGEAPASVQRRLLAAIREFKYTPARRDGTPIPSQLDIVVHIPS
jgi:TonB family protein